MNARVREALRIGRCGPISRATALAAARTRLPGSEFVAFGLLGKPRRHPVEVDVVRDGLRWHLDLRDDAHRLMYLDLYETELRHRVLELLPPGGTFVDAGANVGFWSVPAARRAGPGGRVIAFEPNPWAAKLLRRNVEANAADSASVEVRQSAVGDKPGSLRLYAADLEEYASQVTAHPAGSEALSSVTVTVVALADETEGAIDVLKIDVEGHEGAVLDGAAGLLESGAVRTVVIELQDSLLVRAGSSAEAVTQRLEGFGYAAVDGDGDLGRRLVTRPIRPGFYETVVWRRPRSG
jgi:FkbM family methyltransferase